jgi:hypothetical protein
MSASREKLRRKQQSESGGGTNSKNARTDINTLVFRNLVTVICVLLVLTLIAVILVGQGIPQQFMTAVNAEGQSITVAEFNFIYHSALQEFYNEMGSFLVSYGMLDPSLPLHRQESWEADGSTWHDYLVEEALGKIRSSVLWSETAKREGVELTADDIDLINDIMQSARDTAAAQGTGVNRLLSSAYGRGVNESNYRRFLERQILASRYETHLHESFSFSEQEITDYYNANKNDFDKIDYREFRVSTLISNDEYEKLVEERGESFDPGELVDSPIGEIPFEVKLAFDRVSELANDPLLNENTFNELANMIILREGLTPPSEDFDHTLIRGASFSGDDHDHGPDCDHEHDDWDEGLNSWLFDAARRRGDVTVVLDGNDYVAAMFLERVVGSDRTVTMRQIFVTPVSDNDAGWDDAENRARAILDSFDDGDEQKFISLVKDNTADQNTRNTGGLYREMHRGFFDDGDAISEWLFNAARKPGDVEIIRGHSGVHILYFSSWERPFWQVDVENTLRGEQNSELRIELSANAPNPSRNWLGMMLVTRA